MTKGNSGLAIGAIAAIAFALTFLEWSTALILILGFVILVEKNDWLIQEVVKAFYLLIGYEVLTAIIYIVVRVLQSTIGNISFIYRIIGFADTILGFIIKIALLLICFAAVSKVVKEEDSVVPIIDKYAKDTVKFVHK